LQVMSSFLKELEALNAPVAEIPDLEDYNFDNKIKAKPRRVDDSDEDMPQDEVVIQRRRIVGAVELHDPKYKGEKVSRADMFGDSSEMNGLQARKKKRSLRMDSDEEDDDDDDEEDSDEGDDGEDEEESDDDDIQLDELNKDDDDDEDDSGEDEEEEEEDDEEAEEREEKISMKELVKPIDEDEERKKGESVRKQMDMCEQILLLNIKSHGAMRFYNQMPRGETAKALVAGADEKTRAALSEAHKNALKLVAVLLEAERVLLGGSSQTKELLKEKKEGAEEQEGAADSEDEEIESSEDEDEEEKGGKGKKKNGVVGKKAQKKSFDDEDDEMEEEGDDDDGSIPDYNVSGTDDSEDDEAEENGEGETTAGKKVENLRSLRKQCIASEVRFEQFRSSTLQKWDGRTRLAAVGGVAAAAKQKKGDFSAFEGDVLAQIEKILSDKRRLVARTQSKRSDHERIGGEPEATHDVEIFDDDDFYQVLLRDLIERKQAVDTNDPIAMSRQWLEIEKLRQKRKKKNVDTRASKGRKVRYTVIPKLVNFFPAVPEGVSWTHEMRNELFKSLFT
ncbi:hypothetical protein PFISCL1PPCAC_21596, partial [Pristionchus fissidentatus]